MSAFENFEFYRFYYHFSSIFLLDLDLSLSFWTCQGHTNSPKTLFFSNLCHYDKRKTLFKTVCLNFDFDGFYAIFFHFFLYNLSKSCEGLQIISVDLETFFFKFVFLWYKDKGKLKNSNADLVKHPWKKGGPKQVH